MNERRIAVVVGSLRRESYNRQLANAIKTLAPQNFTLYDVRIDDLPLYNQDDDGSQAEPVKRLKNEIASSNGVIFVTPEYNRSVPGVLKNAIDHGSRPYGRNSWKGKPAGVLGASVGAAGTSMAPHLRNILAYLDAPALGQPEVFIQVKPGLFDQDGKIANADTNKFLQAWTDSFSAWVEKFA